MAYKAICLECKNEIEIAKESLETGDHFECPTCGITLEARAIDGDKVTESEIVEMEK